MSRIFRALTRGKYTVLAVVVALVLVSASAALAGSGVGGVFNLGKTNTVNAVTKLVGNVGGSSLVIDNNSSASGASALNLQVQQGRAPMKVSNNTKVDKLNADQLDGRHANDFLPNATYTESVSTNGTDIGGGVRLAEEFCDAGDVVLSGGHFDLDAGTTLRASGPDDFHEGWQLQWINDGTVDTVTVSVYCADI